MKNTKKKKKKKAGPKAKLAVIRDRDLQNLEHEMMWSFGIAQRFFYYENGINH